MRYIPTDRKASIIEVLLYISFMWVAFFVQQVSTIGDYGIYPRELMGLIGVVTAPFLHADLNHIWMNTSALFIFGMIYSLVEGKRLSSIFWLIIILEGLMTWAFAGSGNHIGASGLVFGLFGFSLLVGFFHKNIKYILLSVTIGALYGSMISGMTPFTVDANVSWEGHLFGFIAGAIVAKYKNE